MSYLGDACDAARGLQCPNLFVCLFPKETCKTWTGKKSLWGMFFQTNEQYVMKFSEPSPVVKQKNDAGNTVFGSSVVSQNLEQT